MKQYVLCDKEYCQNPIKKEDCCRTCDSIETCNHVCPNVDKECFDATLVIDDEKEEIPKNIFPEISY
jgi:hypothetical protein